MDCRRFQELIDAFIYDKIEYSDDLEEFIDHTKNCKTCNEELSLYYTIHRGLGDIPSPDGEDNTSDCDQELKDIISFYEEYFYKQKFMKKAGKISISIFVVMILCTIVYVFLRISQYI